MNLQSAAKSVFFQEFPKEIADAMDSTQEELFRGFWAELLETRQPVYSFVVCKCNLIANYSTSAFARNYLEQHKILEKADWKLYVVIEKARLFLKDTCETSCCYFDLVKLDPMDLVNALGSSQVSSGFKNHVAVGKWNWFLNWLLLQKYKGLGLDSPRVEAIDKWVSSRSSTLPELPETLLDLESVDNFTLLQVQRYIYKNFNSWNKIEKSLKEKPHLVNDFIYSMTGVQVYFVPAQDINAFGFHDKKELLYHIYVSIHSSECKDSVFISNFIDIVHWLTSFVKGTKMFKILSAVQEIREIPDKSYNNTEVTNLVCAKFPGDPEVPRVLEIFFVYYDSDSLDEYLTNALKK